MEQLEMQINWWPDPPAMVYVVNFFIARESEARYASGQNYNANSYPDQRGLADAAAMARWTMASRCGHKWIARNM